MKSMRGRLRSKGFNGGLPFKFTKAEIKSLPTSLDWRLYGAVSTTLIIEAFAIKTGRVVSCQVVKYTVGI